MATNDRSREYLLWQREQEQREKLWKRLTRKRKQQSPLIAEAKRFCDLVDLQPRIELWEDLGKPDFYGFQAFLARLRMVHRSTINRRYGYLLRPFLEKRRRRWPRKRTRQEKLAQLAELVEELAFGKPADVQTPPGTGRIQDWPRLSEAGPREAPRRAISGVGFPSPPPSD